MGSGQLVGGDGADRHRQRLRPGIAADPAVASSIFVTMVTDSMGFLAFLGLATWVGLVP